MKQVDYVVLGGGVAGLCAARRLIDLGIQPLVIEAGNYPSHKVCGEFISPSGVAILKKWNIHPLPLYQTCLHTLSQTLKFNFSIPAGSLSHLTLDTQLAQQIVQHKGTVLTETKVQELKPASQTEECHLLVLSSGEKILAKHLLIATGRLPGLQHPPMQALYKGFKAHFADIELHSSLEMFSFPGVYLGMAPVENGRVNLACLAKIEKVKQATSAQQFMQNLIESHPRLRQLLASGRPLFEEWMEAYVPAFGVRSPPKWLRTYWIGDAAGTIPPASGNGLSLALASGYLAAEFASQDDPLGFRKIWKRRSSPQILLGKGLHQLFLNPFLGNAVLKIGQWFPSLAQKVFVATRDAGF